MLYENAVRRILLRYLALYLTLFACFAALSDRSTAQGYFPRRAWFPGHAWRQATSAVAEMDEVQLAQSRCYALMREGADTRMGEGAGIVGRRATLTSEPVVREDSHICHKARRLNLRLVEMPANRWLKLHQQKMGDRVRFSRQEHGGSCFDTKRGRLILFGSNTHGKNWYNSPFVFDPAEETWSQLHPHDQRDTYAVNKSGIGVAGPRGDRPWAMHAFGAIVYNIAHDEMVVASHPGHMVPGRFTDSVAELWADVKKFPTWTFDFENKKWRPLACNAVSFFPYCAAYDSQKHVLLGHKPDGIYQLGGKPRVWKQLTQQVFLQGWHTNAVYDAGEQALVIFGTHTNSNDIEVFYPATGKHRLMPTPGHRPPKDQHNPMAYVPELGQTVVVVDRVVEFDDPKPHRIAEVWLYKLSTDSWTPVLEATLPFGCGMNYHMQYDPYHKCLLLVTGGLTPEVGSATGETTVWALRIELPQTLPSHS